MDGKTYNESNHEAKSEHDMKKNSKVSTLKNLQNANQLNPISNPLEMEKKTQTNKKNHKSTHKKKTKKKTKKKPPPKWLT